MTSLPNFTPRKSAPSVTPVAQTITSPEANSRHVVFLVRVLDAHASRALALCLGVEDQPALHLAADAAQRAGRQHAFRRAAGAEIDVDAGILGLRRVDDAGDVAIGDEPDRRTRLAAGRR